MSELRVIFSIAGLSAEDGGPSRSTLALARELARLGTRVDLVTSRPGRIIEAMGRESQNPAIHRLAEACCTRQWYAPGNGFYRFIASRRGSMTVLHDTGLWLANNHASAAAARACRIPLVVSPRGMLSPWCLRYRGLKKRIAWFLYAHRDVTAASVLHATSLSEAKEFSARRLSKPVAVIPNGVEFPDRSPAPPFKADEDPGLGGRCRTALFLSRLHPKKGLIDLMRAWAALRPRNWRVIVAGGGTAEYERQLKEAVSTQSLAGIFEFIGEVDDQRKWKVYSHADLFVLPSKSENFGLAIGEALASGVPVITTQNTPWQELEEERCGWWIQDTPAKLVQALNEAIHLSDQQRREMGERGRALIARNYSWAAVARQMKEVYEWLCGAAPSPRCVRLEPFS